MQQQLLKKWHTMIMSAAAGAIKKKGFLYARFVCLFVGLIIAFVSIAFFIISVYIFLR